MRAFLTTFVAAAVALMPLSARAADAKAAEKVLRDNDCTKCHSVAKEKEGPAYKKVAEKYKGKPDAAQKLTVHMTSEPIVEVDGKKEKHKMIKADDAAVKNLVEWILSR
jgi:cytochrome c